MAPALVCARLSLKVLFRIETAPPVAPPNASAPPPEVATLPTNALPEIVVASVEEVSTAPPVDAVFLRSVLSLIVSLPPPLLKTPPPTPPARLLAMTVSWSVRSPLL